jgi:hypothetical protein
VGIASRLQRSPEGFPLLDAATGADRLRTCTCPPGRAFFVPGGDASAARVGLENESNLAVALPASLRTEPELAAAERTGPSGQGQGTVAEIHTGRPGVGPAGQWLVRARAGSRSGSGIRPGAGR